MDDLELSEELIARLAEESGMTQYVAGHNKFLERFANLLAQHIQNNGADYD